MKLKMTFLNLVLISALALTGCKSSRHGGGGSGKSGSFVVNCSQLADDINTVTSRGTSCEDLLNLKNQAQKFQSHYSKARPFSCSFLVSGSRQIFSKSDTKTRFKQTKDNFESLYSLEQCSQTPNCFDFRSDFATFQSQASDSTVFNRWKTLGEDIIQGVINGRSIQDATREAFAGFTASLGQTGAIRHCRAISRDFQSSRWFHDRYESQSHVCRDSNSNPTSPALMSGVRLTVYLGLNCSTIGFDVPELNTQHRNTGATITCDQAKADLIQRINQILTANPHPNRPQVNTQNATIEEIRRGYRNASLSAHPDHRGSSTDQQELNNLRDSWRTACNVN